MPPIRATSSESSTGHRVIKRARAIQSCSLCRKKKIKCDRQDPCSACIAKGEYCHWEVPPPPPQHKYQYAAELCSEMTPEEEVLCLRRLVRVLSANVPARTFEDIVKSITPKYKLRDWAQRAAEGSDNDIVPKEEPFEVALPSPALTSSEHEHSDVEPGSGSSCFSSPMISSEEPDHNHGQPHNLSPFFGAVPTFSLTSSPTPTPSSLDASLGQPPHPSFAPAGIFTSPLEPIPFLASPPAMSPSDYAQLQAQMQGLGQPPCGSAFVENEGMRGMNGMGGGQTLAGGLWPLGLPLGAATGYFPPPQQAW